MPVECVCQNPVCKKTFFIPPSALHQGRGQFCSAFCLHTVKSVPERFWEKVGFCPHGEDCPYCCWLWESGRNPAGYGLFCGKLNGHKTRIPAQRVAWELLNQRPFPEGLWGLHHCDVRACVNPWHIYPGTPRQNQRDVITRGRRLIHVRARTTPLMYEPILIPLSEKKVVPPTMHTCQNAACGKTFRVAPARSARGGGLYCSRACVDRTRVIFGLAGRPLVERFWERVQLCEHGIGCENCCWEWKGAFNQDGFGTLGVKTKKGWKNTLVHRLALELAHNQPLPAKHFVFPRCKNRNCCNARHLVVRERKGDGYGASLRRPVDERLWEKVQACNHGPMCPYCCWIWEGTINPNGYGIMSLYRDGKQRNILIHRLAWELVNHRHMSPSLGALHHCDTPRCCNVWHLYPGTQKDNMRDAYHRNRRPRTAPPTQRGEDAYNARLKDADILVIFDLRIQGWTHTKIAEHLHVKRKTISAVLHRQTWTHVELDSQVVSAAQINGLVKLQTEDIPLICQWHANGDTYTSIAQRLNVDLYDY